VLTNPRLRLDDEGCPATKLRLGVPYWGQGVTNESQYAAVAEVYDKTSAEAEATDAKKMADRPLRAIVQWRNGCMTPLVVVPAWP